MGAGVSKMDKDKVKKALSDGNEGLISLLTEISAQSFATVEMDASEVGASHGETTIDHVWKRKLANAIRDTKPAASVKEAVEPLAIFDEIDMEDVLAAIDGQSEVWQQELYDPKAGFNLPPSYPVGRAVAIYLYTRNYPPIYAVINRELWNPDRRVAGADGARGINPRLAACLPFIRYLIDACKSLPAAYVYRGKVRRGVKYVYPSLEHHDPEAHFRAGKTLVWFEFKSTSKRQEVMTRPHFLGVEAGARTLFELEVFDAYCIEKFSSFQGARSEYEVLILPLAKFEVVMAQKNIIDPKETKSLQKSGFPDVVILRQIQDADADQAQRQKAEQERQDAELARQLHEQLCAEEQARTKAQQAQREAAAAAKMKEEEAAAKKEAEAAAKKKADQEAAAALKKKEEEAAAAKAKEQEAAAAATKKAQEEQEAFRRAIGCERNIETLVQGMAKYPSDPAIQEGACDRLGDLANASDENKVKIANLGGIQAILKAMKDHAAEAKVQENACAALLNLGINVDNKVKIAALQGIQAILKGMKDHATQAKVQRQACAALGSLAINDDNAVTIANLGGIQALLKAMKDHATEAKVQESACGALDNLPWTAENQALIKQEGAEELVRRAMSAANSSDYTKEWGEDLLDKLAQC